MCVQRARACLLGALLFVFCSQRTLAQYSSPDDAFVPPVTVAPQSSGNQGVAVPPSDSADFDQFSPLRTALQEGDPADSEEAPGADLRAQIKQLQEDFKGLQKKENALEGKPYPRVKANGFFQADYAWFSQDAANKQQLGNIQDGWDFRRVRFNLRGDVSDNVEYASEMDFAGSGRPSFRDVSMTIRRDIPLIRNLKFGYWRQPFGMASLTSSRNFPLLERGLTQTFVPFRQIGMGTFGINEAKSATYAASVYRFPSDNFGGNLGDSGGYGMAGRVTWLPWCDADETHLLHLGAAYSFANPSTNTIQYQTTNEVDQSAGGTLPGQLGTTPPFVNTGVMPARNQNLFGLELASRHGAFWTQSEVMWAQVNQINAPVVTFPAMYSEAGYLLSRGDRREYDKNAAVFAGVDPERDFGKEGWGAFEIVGRISYIDLNSQNIHGGRLVDLSTGLNWYLNEYAKLQFVHIHSFLDRQPTGHSDADAMVMRVMVSFY
ncbi:MAG TPA: porin [Planctomycetaceae bacterium]|nr:porin [Planctomycetaceae bacterium]